MATLKEDVVEELKEWPQGEEWTTFVMDYRKRLIDEADRVPVTIEEWAKYKYRPHGFFIAQHRPKPLTWIMLLINNIETSSQFNDINVVLVPTVTTLQFISDAFLTFVQQKESAYRAVG